jgi:spermidine synthase
MVQFLNHFFPVVRLDAVEIDPVIVRIARTHFGTRPGPRTRIFNEDAFDYLKRTTSRYDVIYMDAFLKPGETTDLTGVPRDLKTVAFLKSLHGKLRDNGLVVFNLNESMETPSDIQSIREAFPSVYLFRVSGSGNLIVIGSLARAEVKAGELKRRGEALDRERDHGFSFRDLVDQMAEHS